MRFGSKTSTHDSRTAVAGIEKSAVAVAAFIMALAAAGTAQAQLPMPASTAFDITGPLQAATLDPACAANAHCGGTITIQGEKIIVPKETMVLYPANVTTWQEMFALAPAPYGVASLQADGSVGESGLALNDLPVPLTNYEAHVTGNRVLGGPAGADLSIAGLVSITSNSLNIGAGFINFIDYTLGELRVGGTLNDPNCAQGGTALTNPLCSGARVKINDPALAGTITATNTVGDGRFGRAFSPDVRFSVDQENPTIIAGTGFPMCFPRVAPPASDPLCPQSQRTQHLGADGVTPVFDAAVNTNDPTNPAFTGVPPQASIQAPMEVGDYVTYSGIVVSDAPALAAGTISTATTAATATLVGPTTGPWPLTHAAGTYVAAWAITSNIAVYTFPGTNPAYVMMDTAILGTGGLSVLGVGEAAFRTRFEGMTTDVGRGVHLYAVDFAPITGAISDRDYGTIGVDPGAPTGAVKGRWRFRPPCLAAGSIPTKVDTQCVANALNTFLPPPREVRVVIEGAWTPNSAVAAPTAANGLTYGQFRNPTIEYIFPENVPGTPIVPNNFETIPFLAQGGYPSTTGVIPGQLNPWPGSSAPTPACVAPTASAGGPYTVAAGGTVALSGSSTGTSPITFAWTVSSGSVSNAAIASPTFSAIGAASPVTATLSASNACGSASASTSITVNAAKSPTVAPVAPVTLFSGAAGSFAVSGTDPNVPAQALTFTVTQSGTPALVGLKVTSTGASTANVTFTAPTFAVGTTTSSSVTLSIIAKDSGGASSAPATVTVTIKPLPDTVSVTTAQYRLSTSRLNLTVTSSVVSPSVVLTLQPYLTNVGTTFDPSVLGNVLTNTGGGTYTLTLVGAPEPAVSPATPIVVTSSLGASSLPTAITVR